MHSILDIANDINQDIVIIDLTQLVGAQDLDDRITDCKSKNKFVLLYVLDNYQNNAHGHSLKYADYVERVRNQYDNFAYVTPGRHSDDKHISCVIISLCSPVTVPNQCVITIVKSYMIFYY